MPEDNSEKKLKVPYAQPANRVGDPNKPEQDQLIEMVQLLSMCYCMTTGERASGNQEQWQVGRAAALLLHEARKAITEIANGGHEKPWHEVLEALFAPGSKFREAISEMRPEFWVGFHFSDQAAELFCLLDNLRRTFSDESENNAKITVRLPRILLDVLQLEARTRNMSLNSLAVGRLLSAYPGGLALPTKVQGKLKPHMTELHREPLDVDCEDEDESQN